MRLGPTKPQITEASKKTRSLGHVQGLFCGRRFICHMFSTEFKSHHATLRLTVPAKMVPMNWKKNAKVRPHKRVINVMIRT